MGLTTPISTFLKQYPDGGVTIDIERGTSLGVMDQLVAGKLDMAFIAHIISPFSKACPTSTPISWTTTASIP